LGFPLSAAKSAQTAVILRRRAIQKMRYLKELACVHLQVFQNRSQAQRREERQCAQQQHNADQQRRK